MSRIEVNGIYKHAPLTNAQMATTKRNLDREVVIMRDAVTDRATLIPPVTDPTTDASAYPTNYIYAMDYDSTDDGGDNPNIRRHIPTLELLGDVGDNTSGSNWINLQTNAVGTYNYLSGGETIQEAFEKIDNQLVSNSLKYIIDSSTDGSITTSTDGVTPTNTNNGGVYQITLGVSHTLDNSSFSSILGGASNIISGTSTYSTIVAGVSNSIRVGSLHGFIGTSGGSYIDDSDYSAIIAGTSNGIDTGSNNSFIGTATGSFINAAQFSVILVGASQTISASESSIIGAGFSNAITDGSTCSIIGSGYECYIDSSPYSVINGGYQNYIDGISDYGVIGGGIHNYIINTRNSGIFVGTDNYINTNTSWSSYDDGIFAGSLNRITSIGYITSGNFIGAGTNNWIQDAVYSSILSGKDNYIDNGPLIETSNSCFIGSGTGNVLLGSADSAIISGVNNDIRSCQYSGITFGWGNYIGGGSVNSILGGKHNYIYEDSDYNSILGGIENAIRGGATYSSILGGNNNVITSSISNAFILGYQINTTSYPRSNTTFMNNIMLWNRGFELKDKTFNVGDVLMVESDVGGVPYVTWGAAPSTNTYSGLDPIATSAGTYSVKSQGQSIILTSYIAINNAESGSGTGTSTSGMVGTDFTNDGYTFTNYTAISYNTIYGDATGISSQNGLEILDGFAYDIKVKNVNLSWKGPYMKNAPSLAFAYSGGITVTRDGSTRTIEMGDLPTVNVTGTTNAGAYDPSPIYNGYGSSDSADTASPYLFLRYNATTNQVNLGIAQLYIHQKYVYKAYTVYDSVSTDSFFTITWPTESYALPSIGSTFYFWTSNPATNSSLGSYTVANVVGNDVTVDSNFGNVTNGPCWIFVPGKLPYLTATFDLDITKTAV